MDAAQFILPVRLVIRPGEPVTEIYSAEEASDFLKSWPTQDGPIMQRAHEACSTATDDTTSCEEARNAFLTFARASGILARDVSLDSLYEGERLKQLPE